MQGTRSPCEVQAEKGQAHLPAQADREGLGEEGGTPGTAPPRRFLLQNNSGEEQQSLPALTHPAQGPVPPYGSPCPAPSSARGCPGGLQHGRSQLLGRKAW